MKKEINMHLEVSQIEEILYSIQPTPGSEFQQRMETAPWNTPRMKENKAFSLKLMNRLARIAVCALVLVALAFSPHRSSSGRRNRSFFQPDNRQYLSPPAGSDHGTYSHSHPTAYLFSHIAAGRTGAAY